MELTPPTPAPRSCAARHTVTCVTLTLALSAAWAITARANETAGAASPISAATLDQWSRQSASASFHEFVELLAIPNDQQVPADIQKNAAWLGHAFKRRGFAARELPNGDKPMVFAEYAGASPRKKTVLLYIHLDGQPVTAGEWKQESPWKATLKRRDAQGGWETLPLDSLYGKDVDPEW